MYWRTFQTPLISGILLLGASLHAACGSCGEANKEAAAPLRAEPEALTFSGLPEAKDPFLTVVPGDALDVPAIALPAKTPLLIRLASPKRLDELLVAYEGARALVGGERLSWRAESLLGHVLNFDPAGWVAREQPATLFFVDPTRFVLGEVLVLGIHDTDALLEAFPKGTFDADEAPPSGHTAAYRTKTGTIYVDFLGQNVVFTTHDATYAMVKDFIAKELPKWRSERDASLIVDVANMKEAFAREIALTREDPTPGGKRGSGVPLLSKPALLALVDGFTRLSAEFDLAQGHFKVRVSAVKAKEATGSMAWLADWVSALAGRTTVPIAGLPQGTWAAGSLSADLSSDTFTPVREAASSLLNQGFGDLLDLTPAEREASSPLWGRFADLVSGGVYAFAFEEGELPACGALVARVEDAHRARFLTKRLLETFLLRIVPRIQDEEIPIADMPFPDGDFRTVTELFKALNEVYQQVGIEFYESAFVDAGQDIAVEALGIRFDTAKRQEAAKAGKGSLADVLGSKVELALAFRGNLVALALSPSASHQAAMLVSGGFGSGAGPFRPLNPGESGIAALALDRLVTSVPSLWPKAADTLDSTELKGDTSLSLEAVGDTVAATLSLPVRAVALLEALNKRKPRTRAQKAEQKPSP